jgi:nucleotide-binding universal stress UspA family protein
MHIRNIMVGYDDSPPARRALALAEDLAAQYGARLVLLTVLPPLAPVVPELVPFSEVPTKAHVDDARRPLEAQAERLRAAGRLVDVQVEVGDPVRTLLEIAERLEVDITVLGRSGKGAVARLIMGSVTTSLLHLSKRPILVVP